MKKLLFSSLRIWLIVVIASISEAISLTICLYAQNQDAFFHGYTLMQQGEYDSAIQSFKKTIETNPTHGPSYSNLALCLERLEKYDDAIAIWERYKQFTPLYEDRIKNHISLIQEMKKVKGTVPDVIASPPKAGVAISQIEPGLSPKDSVPILETITKDTYPGSGIRLHALRLLGSYYFANKAYKDCIRICQSLMADYPKELTEDVLLKYAQSLQEEEKYPQAVETYKKIPNPSPDIQTRLIICLSESGQDKEVISLSNNLLKETIPDLQTEQSRTGVSPVKVESGLSPDLVAEIIYRRGISYKRLGKLDSAIKEFTQLIQDYPESSRIPDAIYETGICYQKNGDNKKALDEFQKFIQEYPTHELINEVHYQKGLIHYTLKENPQAIDSFIRIPSQSPRYPEALYYISEYQSSTNPKDYTYIIKQLNEVISLSPRTELAGKSQYLLIKVYSQIREYAKRDQAYLQYITNYPKYYKPDEVAKIGIQLGDGYFKAERYNEALAIYNLILIKFPNTKQVNEAKANIARCLEKSGKTKEALSIYSQLKGEEELKGDVLESMADIYAKEGDIKSAIETYEKSGSSYRKEGKYDSAIKVYEKIIKTTSNVEQSMNAQIMLAVSLVGKKEFEQGITQLRLIIARYPNQEIAARAQYLVGSSYLLDQKYEEALTEYQKLVTQYPKSFYVPKARELVEKLKKMSGKENKKMTD